MQKTFKRETALVMLVILFALHMWGIWKPEVAEVARFLTAPIFLFAGGAYGLDAVAKQMNQ